MIAAKRERLRMLETSYVDRPAAGERGEEIRPVQRRAMYALLAGFTISEAAEAAGVHRSTLHRWLRDETFRTVPGRGRRAGMVSQPDATGMVALRQGRTTGAIVLRARRRVSQNVAWKRAVRKRRPGKSGTTGTVMLHASQKVSQNVARTAGLTKPCTLVRFAGKQLALHLDPSYAQGRK